ncbi:MAG TPA: FkbM family methyltransferase [Solirubrobacteraceae bacterium]|jgi:FkbM family methyltransferase
MATATPHGVPLAERAPRPKLHPAKVRQAAKRRWFEFRLERLPLHPVSRITVGRGYGAWTLPGGLIEPTWVCYSVGAGGDTTFDLQLIERFGIPVRAVEPVAGYVAKAIEEADGNPKFSIHQAAIAAKDGPLRMQLTHDPGSESVSSAGLYESSIYVELPGRALPSLMSETGDSRVDLLKLDVEGGEYTVVPTLDLRAMGVKIFAIQLHHTGSVTDALALIQGVKDQGYELVTRRAPVKLVFARRDLI